MDIPAIKKLIASRQIETWADVYGYMTVREMAEAFGRDAQHWGSVRNKPLMLTIQDMHNIMDVLDLSRKKFLELVGGGD